MQASGQLGHQLVFARVRGPLQGYADVGLLRLEVAVCAEFLRAAHAWADLTYEPSGPLGVFAP